ncbi:MAG: sigma-E processing peptidase SpoIIGA [Defluviitaleaceae bacterium]|nr:sigma-E processing peptidase SpoIIGA [Defluviitaleaceae bacterium]
MRIEIYADVLFLVNFLMNLLAFYLAMVLCRKSVFWLRLILGAAISAAIYCLLLFSPLARFLGLLSSLFILGTGLFIAAKTKTKRDFLLLLLMTYVNAFALSGAVVAVENLFAPRGISTMGLALGSFSAINLAIGAVISFMALKIGQKYIFKKLISGQAFCSFRVYLGGRSVIINALIDTGNSLIEPISKSPVIVAEFDKIQTILPEGLRFLFRDNRQDNLNDLISSAMTGGLWTRLRMIPFSSVGSRKGVMVGFKPDKIEIINQDTVKNKSVKKSKSKEKEEKSKTSEAIIGICNFALSADGGYHALMNPTVL